MAINDIVQTIAEARVDARSLSEFVFKPAGFKVARRLAPTVDTLQFYIDRLNSLNGDFSSSVSVALSSLNSSVAEADGKVAYIETTVQDAINNTAVEGGVLADTFVTMTKKGEGAVARNLRDINADVANVKDFGAKCDGVTDDTVSIQLGIVYADMYKKVLYASGDIVTTDTLYINTNVDFRGSTITFNGVNKTAIEIRNTDNSYVKFKNIFLPDSIVYANKTALGWADADAIGVKLTNVVNSKIHITHIKNFTINFMTTAVNSGSGGRSTAYNEYYIGHLDNGKINLLSTTEPDSSWNNEHNYFGGRYSHNPAEGTAVEGSRHIALLSGMNPNAMDCHVFHKPSIEGNVPEYHAELQCTMSRINSGRWEASPPRVLYSKLTGSPSVADHATYNTIDGGFRPERIVFTKTGTGGGFNNELRGILAGYVNTSNSKGGFKYYNTYGANVPVISIYKKYCEDAALGDYGVSFSADDINVKKTTDEFPRISLSGALDGIMLGVGTSAPPAKIRYAGALGVAISGATALTSVDGANLGTGSFRWGNIYSSQAIGLFGSSPPTSKPEVTGSLADGTALKSLLTALASYGLITDSTSE